MSTRSIDLLLKEIPEPSLRDKLVGAIDALRKQTRFGLVFEGHHPEVSRLPNVPVRRGSLVVRRGEKGAVLYRVQEIQDVHALCVPAAENPAKDQRLRIPIGELVVTRRFGDAIYPSLRQLDSIGRGEGKPWHILLQADNYHALQTLLYTHEGKIDCMYLDPPYNTGARDWKYNNNYVDGTDPWKHSKWLSFMEKRLVMARRLLKPDGVIIITIDEHEVHHLGCLLEQTLPEFYRQMVTIVVNPKGVTQGRFSRVEEHAIFCFRGTATVKGIRDDLLTPVQELGSNKSPRWKGLLRSGTNARRADRKNMFFPVIVDPARGAIVGVGETLLYPEKPNMKARIKGLPVAWPIRSDGSEGNWGVGRDTLGKLIEKGYVRLGEFDPKRGTWAISYLSKKPQQQIISGALVVTKFDKKRNAVEVEYAEARERQLKTVWHRSAHDAGAFGSDFLKNVFGETGRFSFPKSVYAVRDALLAVVRDKPNAVILDFFGGSGTTLNAVNLINAAYGGQRQCILVTNNEVSEEESKRLAKLGQVEGDAKWEARGICRSVTWPRSKITIAGKREDGKVLSGEYYTGIWLEQEQRRQIYQLSFAEGSSLGLSERKDIARLIKGIAMGAVTADAPWHLEEDGKASVLWDVTKAEEWIEALEEQELVETLYVVTQNKTAFRAIDKAAKDTLSPMIVERELERPMGEGFSENAAYFELGFLDVNEVGRGEAFSSVLPLLWMLAGAKGECPKPGNGAKWLISEPCGFSVLHRESAFQDFLAEIKGMRNLTHIFLVTDSEDAYKEMRVQLPSGIETHMLYSSYLRNFLINTAPNS